MKLLKLSFDGLRMFKDEKLTIDFYASDRVAESRGVTLLAKPTYSQNVMAFAGINATGKTTTLRLIAFAVNLISGISLTESYRNIFSPGIFSETIKVDVLFYHQDTYYRLISEIDLFHSKQGSTLSSPVLTAETLWEKSGHLLSKKVLADVDEFSSQAKIAIRRKDLPKESLDFLPDTVSIASAITKGVGSPIALAVPSDTEWLHLEDEWIDDRVVKVFDKSIRSFEINGEYGSVLEFEAGTAIYTKHAEDLVRSLSSGTIKGTNIIRRAVLALKTGDYLLVDEIENHLNKQLVGMIIDLFEANDTNPNGATLLFSTHYPEILDYLKRKDNVYFLVRNKDHFVSAIRYSDRVKRIENKKSEVFLANYVAGTAPRYADVADLKSFIKRVVKDEDDA